MKQDDNYQRGNVGLDYRTKSEFPVVVSTTGYDPVEKPAHYNQGGIECIEYIRQVLGEAGFKAYCLGNTIKYLHRHDYKGKPGEDLRKAQYYLNAALSTLIKGD